MQPEQAILIPRLVGMCSSNSNLTDEGRSRNLPPAKIISLLLSSKIPKPCLDSRECFPLRKYPLTQVLLGSSQETPAVRNLLNNSSRSGMEIVRMIIRRGAQYRGSSCGVKNGSGSQRVCDRKGGKGFSSFWADGLVDSRSSERLMNSPKQCPVSLLYTITVQEPIRSYHSMGPSSQP